MAHSLFLGMTESGKTSLAKQIAAKYAKAGIRVLVFDPLGDPNWVADFQTHNFETFMKEYWASRKCAVFIDEAGEAAQDYDKELIRTATKGRHWGHANHYISQRGAMIPKSLRDQCGNLFIFAQSLDDAKIYAREYNAPEITEVSTFKAGEYFHTTRFTSAKRGKLF
jgi:hypothetical protein